MRRKWGWYDVLCDEPDHKVKRLTILPNKGISLQSHERRAEQWTLISGFAMYRIGENVRAMSEPGSSITIPKGELHQLTNLGVNNLVIIEVQTGDYFGEDDIERYEDAEQFRQKRIRES